MYTRLNFLVLIKTILFCTVFFTRIAFSQVGIGTTSPHSSAILDLTTQNKGFLPPRIALTGKNDIITIANPISGLLIYNTATAGTSPYNVSPGYYYFNGSSWVSIATGVPDATIDFSVNADPNTVGTTFSPNTPQSKDYIYVSTIDGSQWTWNGTSYVIYIATKTPFYLNNTINDAGNSKTNAVYRNGAIGINQNNPKFGLDISNSQIRTLNTSNTNQILLDPVDTAGPKIKIGTSTDSVNYMELGAYSGVNNINSKTRDFKIFNASVSNAMIVKTSGNIGFSNNNPTINLSVGATNLNQRIGRAIIDGLSQHNSNKRDTFSIGRWDGPSQSDTYFLGLKLSVATGANVGEAYDNQSFMAFHTWGSNIADSREVMRLDHRGRLGIGTSPSYTFDLNSTNDFVARFRSNNIYGTSILLNPTFTGGVVTQLYSTANSNSIGGGKFVFVHNNINALTINSLGNIGFGTTSPNAQLQLSNTFAYRKFVLFENANNDNQFSGIGLQNGEFRFNIGATSDVYRFLAGVNSTTANEVFRITGNGNIGLAGAIPNAQFQFPNTFANRKFVLFENANNDYQFTGFGLQSSEFRFNIGTTADVYRFFAGVNSSSSNEVFRIMGNGNIGVGTVAPSGQLSNTSTNIIGTLGVGAVGNNIQWANAFGGTTVAIGGSNTNVNATTLLVKSEGSSTNLVLDVAQGPLSGLANSLLAVLGNGNVGVGTASPTSRLTNKGSYAGGLVSINANTLLGEQQFVRCTGTSTYSITLPNASSCIGREYNIRNHNTQSLSISTFIDATNNSATTILSNALLRIVSDGTNWIEF